MEQTKYPLTLTNLDIFNLFQKMTPLTLVADRTMLRAALADAPYIQTVGKVLSVPEHLSARMVWEDGAVSWWQAPVLADLGVRFESLDALHTTDPEFADRIMACLGSDHGTITAQALTDLLRETLVFYVPRDTVVPEECVLDVVLSTAGRMGAMRVLVVIEAGAKAHFTLNLRSRTAPGDNLFLNSLAIYVGDNATLTLHEIQDFHTGAVTVRDKTMTLGAGAAAEWLTMEIGSVRSFSELTLNLAGADSSARINGVYFGGADQRFTMHTVQNHLAPRTTSSLHYKGVVKDQSRVDWTGMIYVDPMAAKTDGFQKNDTLLLSPEAHVFAKPGLEIVTDDVKCSHGTTMTEIDPAQVFYLMSRGIPEAEARSLIIEGFFNSVLDGLTVEAIRGKVQDRIQAKLSQ